MSEFTQALASAAARNRELLSTLAETDYATTALRQNTSYLSDLESQLKMTDKEIQKLHAITEDERKDHVKYRDSTFKRYAHKLGGRKGEAKFVSKSEKEEREFMEAWQKEREAEERRGEMRSAREKAGEDQRRFEHDKSRNENAQGDLDRLYANIFSGPTPELPGEDQLESAVENARQHLEQCQSQVNAEDAAMDALRVVEHRLHAARRCLGDALDMSRWDVMGGGTFADMMERDALSKASVAISQASRHMDEAQRSQPAITPLRDVQVDMGHFVSDVLFDNIFTDLAQHDRIKSSNAQLVQALGQLKEQIELQLQRQQGAKGMLQQAKSNVEEARVELQSIRAEAFERFAGGQGSGMAAPPPYVQAQPGMGSGMSLGQQEGYPKI